MPPAHTSAHNYEHLLVHLMQGVESAEKTGAAARKAADRDTADMEAFLQVRLPNTLLFNMALCATFTHAPVATCYELALTISFNTNLPVDVQVISH